jgi:hypothetical protein
MMTLALIKYKSWTAVEFTLRDASWIYPWNITGSAAHSIKWSSTQVATELAPYRVLMGAIEYTMSKYT